MSERPRHAPGLDADEAAALAELGWTLPPGPTRCPDSSLLLAVDAGVLDPETGERVRAHVGGCETCRTLARDLAVLLDVDPQADERERIRARVLASFRRRGRPWRAVAAGALATAATIGIVVVTRTGAPALPPPAPPAGLIRTQPPTVFMADRPAIERAEPQLTLRGAPANLSVSERIGRALDAADAGGVDEAVRQLRALVVANPESADAHLALGAVLLRAGRPADAVPVLERARTIAGSRATEEFDWFLAVALVRSGNRARALEPLAALCPHASVRGALACAGLAELDRSARR